ncbi:battenin CLN3 protein [Entomortierella chlamydospora]|uniref:Protein BTN n=1 Tax=Entomortierella chlamydospora TaxID=101097 RepID=A0A9P6MUA6_9FUNG|nr:battenin CLN3 protein [Entomortierella chlamydospora]
MVAPYFIHKVPYPIRVIFCASLSFGAVVLIAMADKITVRILGIMMASLSSGLGELTFLMLSSFYRLQMVSAWSSGTGGAGLLGALLFLALTSWVGLSIPYTLGVVALFPIMMLVAYFIILTNPPQESSRYSSAGYRPISSSSQIYTGANDADDEGLLSPRHGLRHRPSLSSLRPSISLDNRGGDHSRDGSMSTDHRTVSIDSAQDNSSLSISTTVPTFNGDTFTTSPPTALSSAPWDSSQWSAPAPLGHTEPTSINTLLAATDPDDPEFVSPFREYEVGEGNSTRQRVYKTQPNEAMTMDEKIAMAKSLLVPFMLPLFLVYFAEYTMNQGVLPVVLFPLEKTPFSHLRDHYVTYSAIYQLGVFISRSSASLVQIRHLWIPSLLQLCTLLVATTQALLTTPESSANSFPYPLPSIYLVFALIFWEGLLGGATYVHTYIGISKNLEHDPKGKEFALGVVGVADASGILVAGLASLWIEPALCQWQVVERGVELCLAMAD